MSDIFGTRVISVASSFGQGGAASNRRREPLAWHALALIVTLVFAHSGVCGESELRLDGLDVYGTRSLDADAVGAQFATELRDLVNAIQSRDSNRVQVVKGVIASKLLETGAPFAYVSVSPIRYFPPDPGLYVTIDVVETADRRRRMPFRSPPTGHTKDPGGLIALWQKYEARVGEMAAAGTLPPRDECPVLHCLASFSHPDLHPYLERFNKGVESHERELQAVAERDVNPNHRASATFLLAHVKNKEATLKILGRAMFDADSMVRNNAMRVLLGAALGGHLYRYPVVDIVAAMDFPATTDRNKAAFLISVLARDERNKADILARGMPTLLKLLRLQQPNNHDPAYDALKTISGQDYGPRDYEAWDAWAQKQGPAVRQ